jgi:hypothetical protein
MVGFALDRNGQSVPLANGMIVTWLVDMFGGPVPPENKWYKIPDEHLHSGIVVAYVNFVEFLEGVGMGARSPESARPDQRPLITPQFREQNEEEWNRLWNNRSDQCPVCQETPDIWDGPMNSDVPTRCTHWACVICWDQITARDRRCPICRDDLSEWLSERVGASTDSDAEM